MNRLVSKRSAALVRIAVAVLLAAAFTCTAVPMASVSASNTCHLECCAARAPHAPGSCMKGTCHTAIQAHKQKFHRSAHSAASEEFCGLKQLFRKLDRRPTSTDTTSAPSSIVSLTKACDPDCGSCTAGSASAKDQTTNAVGYRPQPLLTNASTDARRTSLDQVFHHRYSPRGPPTNLN